MLSIAAGSDQAKPPPSASFSPRGDAADNTAPLGRILIVEDEYFVALDLEHRLIEAGFTVVGIAASAGEAMAMAAAGKPELAIVDIRLLGPRDGVDVAMRLRSDFGIPSLFATANSDPRTRIRAEEASPRGWLHKPYSTELLIAAVTQALDYPDSAKE